MFDPVAFKRQFPLFEQPDNAALIYLDNAATTQKPAVVIDAVSNFYRHSNANTHRSSHRLARQATTMVENCRAQAAQFLGADSAESIVFCRGATEALNLLAYTLGQQLQPGDEIILSTAEHHANLVPWQIQAQRRGLLLRFVEAGPTGINLQQLHSLLSTRTRVVSLTAASNALGFRVDLPAIKACLREQQLQGTDLQWIVDAAQLCAHEPVNVQEIGCDFLVCSAHKFYGPTGIGLLYGRPEQLRRLPPWQGGGEMITHVSLEYSDYALPPQRFETGTASLAALAGLAATFSWWQQQNRPAMIAYERQLSEYLHQRLARCEHVRLLSVAAANIGMAAFVPAESTGWHSVDLAHWLDEQDIALRTGHHCAMPLMKQLGVGSTLRASLAAYNTQQDVDRLLAAINGFALSTPVSTASVQTTDSLVYVDMGDCDLDDFIARGQWQQRYRLLLNWGEKLPVQPTIRQAEHLVQGCEAQVWLTHRCQQGVHQFAVDSDSRVVKGLAALLLVFVQNKTSAEIGALNLAQQFAALGLEKHLSPSRSNGFYALLQKAMELAGEPAFQHSGPHRQVAS